MKEICRLCGCEGKHLQNIFENCSNLTINRFSDEAMAFAQIMVFPGDGLTDAICSQCITQLNLCRNFRTQCEKTDKFLRKIKIKNENLEEQLSKTCCEVKIEDESFHDDQFSDLDNNDIDALSPEIKLEGSQDHNSPAKNHLEANVNFEKKELSINELLLSAGVTCPNCGKHCKSKMIWEKHSLKKCKSKNTPSALESIQENLIPQPLICEQCGKTFKKKASLHQHLRSHQEIKSISCKLCNKFFSRTSHLRTHMNIHYEIKPIICEICGRSFRKPSDLSRHKLIHSDAKNHGCTLCNRSFKRSGDVISHMRVHTGDRPFKCKDCDKAYSSHSSLKKHRYSCTQAKLDLKIINPVPIVTDLVL